MSRVQLKSIILACGGTGGHVFPAFSVAEELSRCNPAVRIVYACGTKDIEHAIFRIVKNEPVVQVDSAPYRGPRSFVSPAFLLRLFRGICQAFWLLWREKPQVVVGFGGHFSFPVIWAAKRSGIPTILHEQNVIPGVANKVMARFVDGIALSFAETEGLLPKGGRVIVTGNPIRSSIEYASRGEALYFFDLSKDKKTVLVLGGSQGSESVNRVFLEALGRLPEVFRTGIQVLHLCGKMAPKDSQDCLKKLGIQGRSYSFFERMDLAYALADLAIGRAGATFLAEIDVKNIPAVLVPYPFGNNHQLENAKAFARKKRAVIIEQKDLSAERLTAVLTEELERLNTPGVHGPADQDEPVNSRQRLAEFILSFVKNNGN